MFYQIEKHGDRVFAKKIFINDLKGEILEILV